MNPDSFRFDGKRAVVVGVYGITLVTDTGWKSSGLTGSFPPATPIIDFLYGRY